MTCNEDSLSPAILEGVNATYKGCLDGCQTFEGCKFFTFYEIDQNENCFFFGESCTKETPCTNPSTDCITGDLDCEST